MSSLPLSYPYIASAQKKYRSPHAQDLSFPKGATIRVLALAPKTSQGQEDDDDDDDEDDIWLVGELKDGSAKGTFPANCVVLADEQEEEDSQPAGEAAASTTAAQSQDDEPTASAPSISEAATIAATSDEPPAAATQATSAPIEPTDKGVEEPAPTPAPIQEHDTAAAPSASSPAAATIPTPSSATAPATKAGPPPPKPKPSGLAARIAAFNQPQQQQSSAPPPPVPRGGGWKRPAPKEGEKPVLPGAPPAVAAKPTPAAASPSAAAAPQPDAASPDAPTDVHNASTAGRTNEGFSAADAASSIKMSLKERMAALQRGGSESSSTDAPSPGSAKSPPPLAAKPGRLSKERSAAALGSIGGPGVGSQESLGVPLAKTGSRGSMDSERERTVKSPSAAVTDDAGTAAPIEEGQEDDEPSAAPAEGDVAAAAEPAAESEEPSEEEPEAQRRAAIAQRMARLGGQRFGGSGPAMFGAPKPPAPAKKASMASVGSAASAEPAPPSMVVEGAALSEEPAADVATASAADSALSEPAAAEEDKPNTLAVPRRAAPPRKKRSGQPSPGASQDDNMGAADSASASEPTATGDASVPSAAAAEEPHEREGTIDAEKEAAISREAQKQVDEAPVAKDAILETAAPPAADGEANEKDERDELVSGPPPPRQAVHTEKVAGEVKSAERVAQLEGDDADAEPAQDVAAVVKVDDNDRAASPQDDEALQRQTAQLNSFLRDPSRQQSSSSVFTTGSRQAPSTKSGLGGDDDGIAGGDESGSEAGSVPSALAKQLGLTSAKREEAGEEAEEEAPGEQEQDVLREEPEQHEEEQKQERPASPPAHRRMSSSSRPPIPTGASNRTSIPPPARTAPTPVSAPAGEERVASPATTGRPPVPRSPPPPARSPSLGLGGAAAAAGVGGAGISEVLHRAGKSEDDELARPSAPTFLAAPRPRHAIPTEEEEEDEEHSREASANVADDAPPQPVADEKEAPAAAAEEEAPAVAAEEEEPELTEEEQEAARRAAIAKRMAALGGQRMGGLPPIMGAPMPPRRKQTSDSAGGVAEEESAGSRAQEEAPAPASRKPGAPPRGGMAIPGMTTREAVEPDEDEDEVNPAAAGDSEEDAQDIEAAPVAEDDEPLQRISSPPVKPMSPPPVPTSAAAPPRVPASPAPRAPMSPPPRPPSSGARPPIPQVQQQRRQSSIESSLSGVGGYEEDDEDQLGGQASPPQRLASPPPPPRAPPRAPPVAPAQSHGRRPSEASLPSVPSSDAPIAAAAPGAPMAPSMSAQQSTSPRDLDLRPSTHWWRRQPLELPPTISARPDATVLSLDRSPDGSEMRIVVLFEDNSTTTIRIVMRGDADGEDDAVEQHHSAPPPLPRDEEEAKRWSSTVGVAVAKEALLALQQNKGSAPASSSSYGFLVSLLHHLNSSSSRTPPTHRPLPPVSPSSLDSPATPYGLVVFSQVGSTTLERGPDPTPRPGDVLVLAQGAEFKGKRSVGLGSYHDTYKGTCAAIVVEWDSKKRRVKVVGVLPKSSSGTAGVEETTLRLDDVKAGLVRVVRVPPVAWLGL